MNRTAPNRWRLAVMVAEFTSEAGAPLNLEYRVDMLRSLYVADAGSLVGVCRAFQLAPPTPSPDPGQLALQKLQLIAQALASDRICTAETVRSDNRITWVANGATCTGNTPTVYVRGNALHFTERGINAVFNLAGLAWRHTGTIEVPQHVQ